MEESAFNLFGCRCISRGECRLFADRRTHYPRCTSTPKAAGPDADALLIMQQVAREQAGLQVNYEATGEEGRAVSRSVLDALAEQKNKRAA